MILNPKILICDDEEGIVEILSFCIKDMLHCKIFTAKNGKEALTILQQDSIDLIICDFNMPEMNGGEVYQAIIKHNIPVRFVLCSTDSMLDQEIFADQSALYGFVQKPNIIQGLSTIINNFKSEIFHDEAVLSSMYSEVGLHFLLNLSEIPVDIFIKITDDKYVKAYHQGDIFDQTDFVKFRQKGLSFLYSLKADAANLISAINNKIKNLKNSQKDPISLQFEINDLIHHSFQTYGVQPEIMDETLFLIQDTLEMFNQDRSLGLLIEKILHKKENYIEKHSFLLAGVSCFIAKHMSWVSELTQSKLVVCSLLHDVFLKEEDLIISGREIDESEILHLNFRTDNFKSHPQKSAEIVVSIPNLPQDCAQIILEQHEIGPEFGLPNKLLWSKVSPLGQLFSFSHFVVDSMLRLHATGELKHEKLISELARIRESCANYRKFSDIFEKNNIFEA